MTLNIAAIREQFPALSVRDDETARVYFDNPAGTQVPQLVVDHMRDCLVEANANLGGYFETSRRADEIVADAHAAMADLFNATSADEIVFGQNMTSLTFALSRSLGRLFRRGDEIVLSRMDHDANVQPWLLLARDFELTVRWLPFDTSTFEFDLDRLDQLLNERTRLVCVGAASNLIGTINDVAEICRRAQRVDAWTYVDGVQSVPHVPTDVQALGCDFLVASAYKFFGPHQGILWGCRERLDTLEAYKVRPAPEALPGRFETGTQSHEGMAGTAAAVDYFAWIGKTMAAEDQTLFPAFSGRRRYVHAAMHCLADYEQGLSARLIAGLTALPGVTVQGISAADAMDRRVPTISFTHTDRRPADIAEGLARENIFVWSGHNYAIEPARALGILDAGGAVRIGPVHYNTADEIDRTLNVLEHLL